MDELWRGALLGGGVVGLAAWAAWQAWWAGFRKEAQRQIYQAELNQVASDERAREIFHVLGSLRQRLKDDPAFNGPSYNDIGSKVVRVLDKYGPMYWDPHY